MSITFIKHENALHTVYYALHGNTDVYSAYKAQCMFLNNSVPIKQRTLNEMAHDLELMELEYAAAYIHQDNPELLSDLETAIFNLQINIVDMEETNE